MQGKPTLSFNKEFLLLPVSGTQTLAFPSVALFCLWCAEERGPRSRLYFRGGRERKAPPEAEKVLCNHQGAEALGSFKMPDYLGADQRKTKEEEKEDKPIRGQLT